MFLIFLITDDTVCVWINFKPYLGGILQPNK